MKFEELKKLPGAVVRSFGAESVLYYEGDETKMHFLVSGSCKAYKLCGDAEVFLYRLGAGELISDFTLSGAVALSTVEFLEDSMVLSVEFDKLKDHSDFLLSHALKRVDLLNRSLDINLTFDAVAKVAYFLSENLDMFNSFKRKEVASMLNMTSETLSRVLKKLAVLGVVLVLDGTLSVLDEVRLQELFLS